MAEPFCLWSSEDKVNPGIMVEAIYDPETGNVLVRARKGDKEESESFQPNYEPRFGIDVSDMDTVYEIAERLSDQLIAAERG